MKIVHTSELQLGDIVRVFEGPFGDGIVKKKGEGGGVVIERPYMVASKIGGKMFFHIGHEDVALLTDVTLLLSHKEDPLQARY